MRLNAHFVEWMMGLPEGWVTDVPGLTRTEQLKALGNGVVPQQLAMAVKQLLEILDGSRVPVSGWPKAVPEALLPTPNTLDGMPPKTPEQIIAHRVNGDGGTFNLREVVLYEMEDRLLPTPIAVPRDNGKVQARQNSDYLEIQNAVAAIGNQEGCGVE